MEIFFLPMNCFIAYPFLAILPAFVFGVVYAMLYPQSGAGARRVVLTATIVWLLYTIYEWRMSIWGKTVTAPIRVDLLLIAPVLYLTTLAGVWASLIGYRHLGRTSS